MKTWHTDDRSWTEEEWLECCLRERGRPLTGKFRHFCDDWDDLPIDETCAEFSGCACYGTRGADA